MVFITLTNYMLVFTVNFVDKWFVSPKSSPLETYHYPNFFDQKIWKTYSTFSIKRYEISDANRDGVAEFRR